MAENAAPAVDVHEDAEHKEKAGQPLLELIASIPAVLDGGQVKAQWKVAGKDGDNGDFEYFAVVRVPDIDLQSKTDGQKALAVTLKPDLHVIATQVNAVGGAPLAGHKVQAVDPETGLAVGEPAETDDDGKVVLQVPENKPHQIQIVDDDEDDTPAPEQEQHGEEQEHPATPILNVKLLTPTGEPVGDTDVTITSAIGRGGAPRQAKTSAQGELRIEGLTGGAYVISASGKQAKAHTITAGDLANDHEPYRAVLK